MRELAARLGLVDVLYRLGWAGPLAEKLRFLTDSSFRNRNKLIAEDYAVFQRDWTNFRPEKTAPTGKKVWILSFLSSVAAYKINAVLALALRNAGDAVSYLAFDHDPWLARYNRVLGLDQIVDFRAYQAFKRAPSNPEIEAFFKSPITVKRLFQLSYKQVDIGRIALSNLLYRRKFEKLDFSKSETVSELKTELERVQANVLAAEDWLEKERPEFVLALERGLSPAAEVFGLCLARGINTVQYLTSQHQDDYALKRFSLKNRHQHPFSIDPTTWEKIKKMPWDASKEETLLKEFENDYKTGNWFKRKYLHDGKTIKTPEQVRAQLGLDPKKKTAVIFSHVLWDATFFYGEGLFEDYETWLVSAVRAAAKNTGVNWIVKLHPDLVWKIKYENYSGELRDLLVLRSNLGEANHVKVVLPDTDIDTYSFFGVTDYCLTVRGTIGMEMACRGVPVLTAGTGRYSGLGFTIDSSSPEDYSARLAGIQDIPPMSADQRELARRFAYALFKLRPWEMRSFRLVKMGVDKVGHPLDDNLAPAPEIRNAADLLAAPDLRAFTRWVGSNEVDYLKDDGAVVVSNK